VRGGAKLLAVQPGGASSNSWALTDFSDVPLDFQPCCWKVAPARRAPARRWWSQHRISSRLAANVLRFFRNESKSAARVPAGRGITKRADATSDALSRGARPREVAAGELELEEAARMTSICSAGGAGAGG
jgi:NADH:ubiquinone oxidoreductase subunit F (NADH-binding)